MEILLPADQTTIKGNRIGLTLDDTVLAFGSGGINAASGTVMIGGTTANERNLISGTVQTTSFATNVTIIGNYLGTDSTGTLDRGPSGISINTSNTRVGGTASGEGNIIAFGSGVSVSLGTNCAIRANRIFANNGLGIDLGFPGVTANDVGDSDIGPNNLQNFPELTNAVANVGNVVVQGRLNSAPNTVFQLDFFVNETPDSSGHGEGQYYLGSTNVTTDGFGNASFSAAVAPLLVNARYISATVTDPNGNTSEFSPSIVVSGTIPPATFTVINTNDSGPGSLRQALLDVGLLPAAGNDVIQFAIPGSGVRTIAPLTPLPTPLDPVTIDGFTQMSSTPNTLTNGNNAVVVIRLDGTNLPAFTDGLELTNGNNVIRGLEFTQFASGVGIDLNSGSSNLVSGCLLWSGISSTSGSGNRIGGSTPDARNVISALTLRDNTNSVVEGNFIGTDASGTAAAGGSGVIIDGGSSNRIGPSVGVSQLFGNPSVMRNVISGNQSSGILVANLSGHRPMSHRIFGNLIGTDVTGTFGVSNLFNGITLNGAVGTIIGGTNQNEPNLIAFNAGQGVQILGSGATNNSIQANSITDNSGDAGLGLSGLGIDLGGDGTTANDAGDLDNGPNQLQNFPVITNANITTSNLIVQGTLNSRPSTSYRIEFFANVQCDPSTNGEGKHFLGSVPVTTGADGNAVFNANLPYPPEGQLITATATDPFGNTSEFSPCRQYGSLIPPITLVVTNTNDSGPGSLRKALEDSNATFHSGPNRIEFNIAGAGVKTIMPQSPLPDVIRPVILDGFTQPGTSPGTNGNNPVWLIRVNFVNIGTNTENGLHFVNTSSNAVRGLCLVNSPGDCIEIDGGGGHVIEENLIGIDLLAMPSSVGRDGVDVDDARDTVVRKNFIGNARRGINISGLNCINNSALDNRIGMTPAGDPAPIALHGIRPSNASGTVISGGGVYYTGGNVVSSPQPNLHTTIDDLSFGWIGGKMLHDRAGDGISTSTATVAAPQITSAVTSGGQTTIQGAIVGASNHVYTLIFYARLSNGIYVKIREATVTTGADGTGIININHTPALPVGSLLRATADNSLGTSDDFPDIVVMPPGPYGNADLSIIKTDSADPVPVGTNFIYSIIVSNAGPQSATNVIVRDFFPPQLFVTAPPTKTHGMFFGNTRVYIPMLTNGETATLTFTCNSAIFTNVYSNAVTVVSAMSDPNTANNNDFELTTVLPANDPAFDGFRITRISLTNGVGALIEWNSVTGKTYRVQFKSTLNGAWSDLAGDVTATGPTSSKLDNTITGATQRFYRVVLLGAAAAPQLSIARTNNPQLLISWPGSTPADFILATATNLTPVVLWMAVPNAPANNGVIKSVVLDIEPQTPARLFRLRQ